MERIPINPLGEILVSLAVMRGDWRAVRRMREQLDREYAERTG